MKSFLTTTAFSLLTVSSLALSTTSPAQAVSSQRSITPQVKEASKTELLASSIYCETRWVNGYYVSCCIDSYGNWACVY